jgi:hypothetical protein
MVQNVSRETFFTKKSGKTGKKSPEIKIDRF